jgi:multicomponent Na+:H+ antiporter subunit E
MGLTDSEGHPTQLVLSAPLYWMWLAKEIALSAWAVAKTILTPGLPISPTMTVVKASQRTPAGVATYANSITLTPGTITVGASENELTIHALARDGALDVESGRMDKRVSAFEGAS